MRKFSVRPTLTIRGRQFKGLRGWAGKPLHPPLTDIPVGGLHPRGDLRRDRRSSAQDESWACDFFRAGTYVIIGGAVVSVFAALTGFWDWLKSTEKGTQARRTRTSTPGR